MSFSAFGCGCSFISVSVYTIIRDKILNDHYVIRYCPNIIVGSWPQSRTYLCVFYLQTALIR